ncbi:MAG: TonB-dependent receptor [Cytophagales bacterium]|nr:TonB-dependent receptor [Bernardetiaceae bacterium]MDW8209936.1 TonB-dependent receptor [Cytophagales bacterium]
MRLKGWIVWLWILLAYDAVSQSNLVQNIRGIVVDKETHTPLPGAVITLQQESHLTRQTVSTSEGFFQFDKVPIGRYQLQVQFIGYETYTSEVFLSSAAKEVTFRIPLAEKVRQLSEIEVKGNARASQAVNEMASVSVRSFSASTLNRYPFSLGDPARMVTVFAGVNSAGDLTNEIVIRGNPPNGLLWRLQGVDIPSPNHFTNEGGSGGGVSIISPQVLGTSDFMTGAFAAEYGNAISGVFDINLRRGNDAKREFTAQISGVGIDIAAEGPFRRRKPHGPSFLFNYRYSTVDLVRRLNIPLPDGILVFQDLSFHCHLPAGKIGVFSVFGLGGLSAQKRIALRDSARWRNNHIDRTDRIYDFQTGVGGISHEVTLAKKMFLRQTFALTYGGNGEYEARLGPRYVVQPLRDNDYSEQKFAWASSLNYKINSQLMLKGGIFLNQLAYDLNTRRAPTAGRPLVTQLQEKNSALLLQTYLQGKWRIRENITALAGMHFTHLGINGRQALEPRASLQWQATQQHSFTLAYGRHSRMLPLGTYFAWQIDRQQRISQPNKNLDFIRAIHWVGAWEWQPAVQWQVKTELYYQRLFSVPVRPLPGNTFSMLNQASGFVSDSLANAGAGKNYGVELTIERHFDGNWHLLNALSIYSSRYATAEGLWRNTRFNGGHVWNFVAGKDFSKTKQDKQGNALQRVVSISVRWVWSGGFRYTPIDEARSLRDNAERRIESRAFEEQLPDYFRLDLRISLRKNRPHYSSVLSLDLQNVTNRKNVARYYYDSTRQAIHTEYWLPFLPIPAFRVEF